MILYLLIGVVWTAFIDLYLKPKTPTGEPINNLNRLIQTIGWPIWVIVFIYGIIMGITNNDDSDFEN